MSILNKKSGGKRKSQITMNPIVTETGKEIVFIGDLDFSKLYKNASSGNMKKTLSAAAKKQTRLPHIGLQR
jgi:hypothetical protein